MKRVIDGLTYNTDTAAVAARYEYVDEKGYDVEATIYCNRGGALFIVHKWAPGDQWRYHFEPTTRDEIQRLIEKGTQIEIVDEAILSEPPEAVAETEKGATIYIRVPASLKRRVDEAADADGLSGNVWAMRCVERCLKTLRDYPEVSRMAYLFAVLGSDNDWDSKKIGEAHGVIESDFESLVKKLGLADELQTHDFAQSDLDYQQFTERFRDFQDWRKQPGAEER